MKRLFLSLIFALSLTLPSFNGCFLSYANPYDGGGQYPESYKGWQKMYDVQCAIAYFDDFTGIERDKCYQEVCYVLYGKKIGGKVSYRIRFNGEFITIQRGHWRKPVVRYYQNRRTGQISEETTMESYNSRFIVNTFEGKPQLANYCNLDY